MEKKYPDLKCTLITGLYENGLQFIKNNIEGNNLILLLGSSLGNMTKMEAEKFLMKIYQNMRPTDTLMVTFDMKKPYDIIEVAYNDPGKVS